MAPAMTVDSKLASYDMQGQALLGLKTWSTMNLFSFLPYNNRL